MFDESSSRVHEGSIPVSDAHRVGSDRRGPFPPGHSARVPWLEVVLAVAKVVAPQISPRGQNSESTVATSDGSILASASERESSARGVQASARRQRRPVSDDVESRAARAELVHMGELSAARQALEGAALAPGTDATLAMLQNPLRRPPTLRDPIPQDILEVEPGSPFVLDPELFARNIRIARRGAAAGPSGMTADHLRVILESAPDTSSFGRAAQDLARAQVPPDVLMLLRMGRLTASEKPCGGVRGIVCGDIVRRLVAGTIAQSITPGVEAATSPFQCALNTSNIVFPHHGGREGVTYLGQVPLRPIFFFYLGQSYSGQSYLGQAYLGQPLFKAGLSTI